MATKWQWLISKRLLKAKKKRLVSFHNNKSSTLWQKDPSPPPPQKKNTPLPGGKFEGVKNAFFGPYNRFRITCKCFSSFQPSFSVIFGIIFEDFGVNKTFINQSKKNLPADGFSDLAWPGTIYFLLSLSNVHDVHCSSFLMFFLQCKVVLFFSW